MKAPARSEHADTDANYFADVDFGALQGKRYAAALGMLQDAASRVAIVALALILEPLRAVTAWLMRQARELQDPCQRPSVLDYFNGPYSCITHSRQYLATLLLGKSTRLCFLWRPSGCNNLGEWYSSCPDSVRLLRRLAMIASCSLYRRHVCTARKHPWALLRLVDDRIPVFDRLREAEAFNHTAQK